MKIGILGKAVCLIGVVGLVAVAAPAGNLQLFDRNSTIGFDPNSSAGANQWTVDGVYNMWQQWFWYRIGPTGPEAPINQLGDLEYAMSQLPRDSNCTSVALYYFNSTVEVDINFRLVGGTPGSGRSDLAETIAIRNYGNSTLDFHFFQFCDFDINGTWLDANATILGGNTAQQNDVLGGHVSETVVTPRPSHYQVAFWDNGILASLEDGNPTTLTDEAGPVGPGDLTWAFQWDFSIPAGGSVIISKDKSIVPEPATMVLLVGGAMSLLLNRRRRAEVDACS